MSSPTNVAPVDPILTDATVFVLNRGLAPESGQGMLAVSPRGCFYFQGGENVCRTISLDDIEKFFTTHPCNSDEERRIIDVIKSTIITCKNGNHPA